MEVNIPLTINGFNGPKSYNTKIVELPMKMNNGAVFLLRAVCVPKIDVQFFVPGMGNIVKMLKLKRHHLGDKLLNEKTDFVSDVQIMLGTAASFVISTQTVVFGDSSTIIQTPYGVMIEGNLETVAADLP